MYYQVVEEKCGQGIKSRYSKNQRIDDAELSSLMSDFAQYKFEKINTLTKINYRFYYYDLFGTEINLYSLNLNKIK